MSESHEHGITSTPTSPSPAGAGQSSGSPFGAAEITAMHEDDKAAAGHIVKLMCGIFMVGIVIYSVVAIVCSRG